MRIKKIRMMMILACAFISVVSQSAHATFEMSVDRPFVDFGFMDIGEFKELMEQGSYHNEVTCTSDNGNTWYLKLHLLAPLRSGTDEIQTTNFKWKIVEIVNGTGYPANENNFNNFSTAPLVAYTSSPGDSGGTAVGIRFTYGLQVPQTQITGNYQCVMRYTFTETL
jgi:hypothetical protein